MDALLPAVFALGLLGGFKHAFEPDHMIAVSTLLYEEPALGRALRTGLAWGAGHTTMLVAAVLTVGAFRIQVSETYLAYFEVPVAVMLLGLGVWALVDLTGRLRRLRRHRHAGGARGARVAHFHAGPDPHPHGFSLSRTGWTGFAVGLVHGLAGSGALLVVAAATLSSAYAGLTYAAVFGIGSILGMGVVTLGLALSLLASRRRPVLHHALAGLSGGLSVTFGLGILFAMLG